MPESSAIAKLKRLAQEEARAQRNRDMAAWRDTVVRSADFQLERQRYSPNMMGPDEEVVRKRRTKRNYTTTGRAARPARNVLRENLILLTILCISIYGLYKLSIYLLANV